MKRKYEFADECKVNELKDFFKTHIDMTTGEGQKEYQKMCRLVRDIMRYKDRYD